MTSQNKPKKGEFYLLMVDMRGGGRGHGVVFENEKKLRPASRGMIRPEGGGFPPLKETPRLRQSRRDDMPNDLDSDFGGYWLVSEPLKHVFELVDPQGFAFMPCDFILYDGSKGPPHYLCDVVRTLDAIDEAASTVKVLTGYPNGKYYSLAGGANFAFRKDVIGSAHVFQTPYTSDAFCDRVLRDALIESGFGKSPRTRGVRLIDAADI